jgi:hypothetical protein
VSNHSTLFDDEPSRRLWLLSKALEVVPLREALQLAKAAQDFLDGASVFNPTNSQADRSQLAPALPQDDIPVADGARLREIVAVATVEPALLQSEAAPAETSDTQEAPRAPAGLVVVAGPDDVVRYLRRADDVVVATDDGAYMVNGRFRENLEELVKRANRIRARQRQPLFQLMPMSFGRVAEDRVASAAAVSRVGAEQVEQRDMIYGDEAVAAE